MPAALFHGQFWADTEVEAEAPQVETSPPPLPGFGYIPGMIHLPKKKLRIQVREVEEPEAEYMDDDELEALLSL